MRMKRGNPMLAAVSEMAESMALRTMEFPTVAGDEVLIRVGARGIDFHTFDGHVPRPCSQSVQRIWWRS